MTSSDGWIACRAPCGEVYYHCPCTGASQWSHPSKVWADGCQKDIDKVCTSFVKALVGSPHCLGFQGFPSLYPSPVVGGGIWEACLTLCLGMPRHMPWHAKAYAQVCQGICLGMPRHMPRHAKAYALACQGTCLGIPRHMPWHS